MSSIHGVNVGGNLFDVTDSSNVAPIQLTNFATRAYAKDRCFIMADGLLYRATAEIESGDPIVINGNCKRTTLDEIISVIETDSDLIAPTEDGATSSADYAVGSEIVRSGILYKVISAITQGDAFAIGSNIEIAGSLTSQIQTLTNQANDMVNVLGAKNLLPNEGTTQTYRGITFTFLTDGTIVATGTADSNNNAELKFTDLSGREIAPRNKTYILTGCPDGGNGKYNITIAIHNRSSGVFIREIDDVGDGAEFTLGNDEVIRSAFVKIEKGETVNNLIFAPMIRPASVADGTYVPYAMANRDLTVRSALVPDGTSTSSLIAEDISSAYNYTPTRNGVLALVFVSGTSQQTCTARIRDGAIIQYGSTVTVTLNAYSSEPILFLPVKAGRTYTAQKLSGGGTVRLYFIG